MKTNINIFFMLFFSFFSLIAQEYNIHKTFSFGESWAYYEQWDSNEGIPPGILITNIFSDQTILVYNYKSGIHTLYSQDWKKVYQTSAGIIRTTQRYWLEYFSNNGDYRVIISDRHNPLNVLYAIEIQTNGHYAPNVDYCNLTENMLFFNSTQGDLLSWELLPQGKTLFRDAKDTKKWLEDGNALKYGIQLIGNIYYFGDNPTDLRAPLSYKNWKSYIFPKGEFANLQQMPGKFLGVDSKGLSYFLSPYPLGNITIAHTIEPFPFLLFILDTWTKQVYIRKYPLGTCDPPRRIKTGSKYPEVIIIQSWAVHPNGDVYFFDADVNKQEYQLKKLTNDWWKEIGIDQRRIGRIEHNYIPLRIEPLITATTNGYSYEREFVWILEETTKTEIVDGEAVPWIKVRKLDGREGWILLSDVYFE
jgi:hypothetical protein